MGALLNAWAGIDGVTGYRHAAAAQARHQLERDAARVRWACFARSWFHLGAAIVNEQREASR